MDPTCPQGCGKCCDPVVLVFSQLDVASMGMSLSERDRRWILEELRPISRREGLRRAPHLAQGGKTAFSVTPDGQPHVAFSLFYECTNLDPETKYCRVYDDRPDACREYPFGDQPPDWAAAAALPDGCVYVDLQPRKSHR